MRTYFHPFWFGKSFWNILLLVFPCPTSDRRYTSSYMTTDGTADHTSSPHHLLATPPTQSHWEVNSKIGPDILKSKLQRRLIMFWWVNAIKCFPIRFWGVTLTFSYLNQLLSKMSTLQKSSYLAPACPHRRGRDWMPFQHLTVAVTWFWCLTCPSCPAKYGHRVPLPPVLLWLTDPTEQCLPLNSQRMSLIDSWNLLMQSPVAMTTPQ